MLCASAAQNAIVELVVSIEVVVAVAVVVVMVVEDEVEGFSV